MSTSHPYYPVGAEIPNYIPNELGALTLCSIFAVASIAVLVISRAVAIRLNPQISFYEYAKVFWFSLCSPIHFVLEGYYARNFATLQGSLDLLAQLWKEYSLSDSRYLTSDGFTMCMESVTAWCWGPLTLLLAYFTITDHPFRHPLQIIVSTGQLYGNVLYLGIVAFDASVYGLQYSRPEDYYFYGYFVLLNGFWIVIPILLIAESVRASAKAFAELQRLKTAGVNGDAKKRT
ncbi:hypothetical protein N7468_006842 [Penicillium chermesinum]|uniref:EXPERA domain-containing protein n=1 Tax=Penicillium chermesinum TaxID=63820 RepID=A0A9W9TJZ3_9EURO|nr:uncharacterized protein N7468_006842 [Penicillium chermesinum]KAJ5225617.1 hypothetical protein N7468_006842 [Penicillium chermesinum]KAJ6161162.1 hypothetical protein N7470_004558 [Penicillium chermesinum]